MERDMVNQEALITLLRGQVALHGSSECLPALKLTVPFRIAASIEEKKSNKK